MLNKLIHLALSHRAIVIGLGLLLSVWGFETGRRLPVEVLPDLTKPTVTILTEAPGLAPEEVEARVTQPIESVMMGVPGLTRLRSNSDIALSLVFVEFGWGTDIYRARQWVQERLQSVRERLPEGVEPALTPVASLMGEIMLVGLRNTNGIGAGALPPMEVRTLADWTVRPRLLTIPGVAEVLSMGGGVKQVEIQPEPHRMQAFEVSLEELKEAAALAASTSTGGFLERGSSEVMVRNLAMTVELDDIDGTVIKVVGQRPVRISDVARVAWGIEPMRGDAAIARAGEHAATPGVILSVTKAPGFDTLRLTAEVEAAIEALRPTLPAGVEAVLLFRQADFIEHAVGNLKHAIGEGALMVTAVLFLFLLNVRTTVITLMAIPLSFAVTLLVFDWAGISVNSMTLGGLAVAIGMVVDDAIVDVENVYRRLRENAALAMPQPALRVIARASGEVRNSIFYATLLIVMVFLPLLGLSGVEGRLFSPIAVATMVSMAASFVVSLTAIPVLCSLLLRPEPGREHGDNGLVRWLKSALERTLLRVALDEPILLLAAVGLMLLGTALLFANMGKDFLPAFNEETALIATAAAPGTSLAQMNELSPAIERQILSVPEVSKVGRRVGRAERGDHVVPVSTVEFDIDFEPGGRPRTEVLEDIRTRIQSVPGVFSVLTGPLADRIGHMLSGVSAPVAVKIFGPDLDRLRQIGGQIQKIAQGIPGLEDAKLDQQSGIRQVRIEVDRERAAAYGIAPGTLNQTVATLVGGEVVAELQDGQRVVHLVIRLPEERRDSAEKLADLPLEAAGGARVPVESVAAVREAKGPNVINREGSQRRFAVAIKPTARDVTSLVEQLRREVTDQVRLPEGYFVTFEGEFEAQRDASRRIALLSVLVLAVIGFLLFSYFRTPFFAVQVLCDIPLALMGGIVLTYLIVDNVSIATLVGLIAVAGVAARNSIMLLSHYLHLMQHEGEQFTRKLVVRGTQERLVPVLMTALSAGIALVPLVLAADQPGKEILHPVAVVICGGLVTSTFLGLGVTPAVFFAFGRKAAQTAIENEAPASH